MRLMALTLELGSKSLFGNLAPGSYFTFSGVDLTLSTGGVDVFCKMSDYDSGLSGRNTINVADGTLRIFDLDHEVIRLLPYVPRESRFELKCKS